MKVESYTAYILRSEKDGRFYTGRTNDLCRRVYEHNRGKVSSTRNRRPLVLVHTETFGSKTEAYARERYLKSLEGGAIKKLLVSQGDSAAL